MAPTRVPKMAEVIAGDLRRRIIDGAIKAGDSLPSEAKRIAEYEVSRPTLREAMRLLEMDQLITVRRGSHRGAVARLPGPAAAVRNMTMLLELRQATLADVYNARTIFEPPACRLAALHAPEADIARLGETLENEIATADPATYPVPAWRFHTELVELSGNATLAVVAATLQHISQRHATKVLLSSKDQDADRRAAIRAHRKVVDLIAARRGDEAERFWRKHMDVAGQTLLRDIGNQLVIELLD